MSEMASVTNASLNTVTISTATPPVTRVGWQCPGCKVHYSPDVQGCSCATGTLFTPPVTVTWPWYVPYSGVPGCAGYPGWVFTYNATTDSGPSSTLTG